MDVDPFSEILRLTKAEALVTGGFTAGGRWALRFPARDRIKFFVVGKGTCWMHISGQSEPLQLKTGDVGLLAPNQSFFIGSNLKNKPIDAVSIFSAMGLTTATLGNGEEFEYIGGHVILDRTSGPLLASVLPRWIHIKAGSPKAKIFRWIVKQLIAERASQLPGGHLAESQLTQLLFIQILRADMESAESMSSGWLRALADPGIGRAVQLLHSEPARAWSLTELAQACNFSRTTFATRFRETVGVAPLTYLTHWRMRLAERALREEDVTVAALAQRLGYASESSFSNAFKRVTGHSPRVYRSGEA